MPTLKKERSEINNLTLHFKQLEKNKQTKHKLAEKKIQIMLKTTTTKPGIHISKNVHGQPYTKISTRKKIKVLNLRLKTVKFLRRKHWGLFL